jgi:hypothetical protein
MGCVCRLLLTQGAQTGVRVFTPGGSGLAVPDQENIH